VIQGQHLQGDADLVEIRRVLGGREGDVSPPPRDQPDQPGLGELPDRLAHGRSGDVELLGQVALGEALPGLDLALDDVFLDLFVDELPQVRIACGGEDEL